MITVEPGKYVTCSRYRVAIINVIILNKRDVIITYLNCSFDIMSIKLHAINHYTFLERCVEAENDMSTIIDIICSKKALNINRSNNYCGTMICKNSECKIAAISVSVLRTRFIFFIVKNF